MNNFESPSILLTSIPHPWCCKLHWCEVKYSVCFLMNWKTHSIFFSRNCCEDDPRLVQQIHIQSKRTILSGIEKWPVINFNEDLVPQTVSPISLFSCFLSAHLSLYSYCMAFPLRPKCTTASEIRFFMNMRTCQESVTAISFNRYFVWNRWHF